MISGLKNSFVEMLGNLSRWFFIGGGYGLALRHKPDGVTPDALDITGGNGTGGEASTDWGYAHARAKLNIDNGDAISPDFVFNEDGKGEFNNLVTLIDLMGRVADLEFSIDGDTAASVTYQNQFGIIHTSGSNFNEGALVYCRETSTGVYEFIEINLEICKLLVTRNASGGTLGLDADWIYEWNGSVWRKKCDSAAATPGVRVIREDFAYNSGTTAGTSATIPSGAVILRTEIIITTAFNATNATIQVNGGGINSIMPTTGSQPNGLGLWVNDLTSSTVQKAIASSNTGVVVTVVQGSASQGAGYCLVHFVEAEL
jgi:hypothetical protein